MLEIETHSRIFIPFHNAWPTVPENIDNNEKLITFVAVSEKRPYAVNNN